jgi:guanylate kinase
MKRMLCLVGESGSGKTTLAEKLEGMGHKVLPSYTTRPRRSKEEKHHIFVERDDFLKMRNNLVAYTIFDGHEYGATLDQFKEYDVYVVDLEGVRSLVERIGREQIVVVYLSTSEQTRMRRMSETRGTASARKRIDHDKEAFSEFSASDVDLMLRNEFPSQLNKNVFILSDIIKKNNAD